MLSYHDTLFVIAGKWRFEPSDNVLRSTNNGINWSNTGLSWVSTFPPRYNHSSVVYQDLMWIIGGATEPNGSSSASIKTNDCWYSADGKYWYEAPQLDSLPPMAGHSSVVFDDKIWVMNENTVWCGEAVSIE